MTESIMDEERLNPDGNERLTAAVGVVLIVLTVVELATLLLGLHQFLSLHVFVGLALIPLVLLKLASTGWRFTRYYTRSAAYRLKGAPQLMMRLLAPALVATTVLLFGSGVAMGILQGHSLSIARNVYGPASVAWMILVGVHVLVYLRRALVTTKEDVDPASRTAVRGASARPPPGGGNRRRRRHRHRHAAGSASLAAPGAQARSSRGQRGLRHERRTEPRKT